MSTDRRQERNKQTDLVLEETPPEVGHLEMHGKMYGNMRGKMYGKGFVPIG